LSFRRSLDAFRRVFDRRDDSLIGPAPADIPIHKPDDFRVRRIRPFPQHRDAGHNHPAGAIAALKSVVFQEGFLKRMKLAISLQAFDRENFSLPNAPDCQQAGPNSRAIQQDSACAATPLAASVFGAREIQVIAQDAQQRPLAIDINRGIRAIDINNRDIRHNQLEFEGEPS
jgi:hypothetical protein